MGVEARDKEKGITLVVVVPPPPTPTPPRVIEADRNETRAEGA